MKNFICENTAIKCIVATITLVTVYVILYVGLGLLWPLGVSANYKNINSVLLNLSYSYVSALIFFLFYELFPAKSREKKAFQICESQLSDIYHILGRIIAIAKFFAGVDKNDEKISLSDLSQFTTVTPEYDRVYVNKVIIKDGKESNYKESGCLSLSKDLSEQCKTLRKRIGKLVNLPNSIYLNSKLLTIISTIELNKFISLFTHKNDDFLDQQPYNITGFDTGLIELIAIHIELGKFVSDKMSYRYTPMGKEDIGPFEEEREKVIKELEQKGFKSKDQLFFLNYKRYKFRNGELY